MTKIAVNLSAYPKGAEISLGGLPPVENGKSRTLTDEEVQDFEARHNQTVSQFFKKHKEVKVTAAATKKPSTKKSSPKKTSTTQTQVGHETPQSKDGDA